MQANLPRRKLIAGGEYADTTEEARQICFSVSSLCPLWSEGWDRLYFVVFGCLAMISIFDLVVSGLRDDFLLHQLDSWRGTAGRR